MSSDINQPKVLGSGKLETIPILTMLIKVNAAHLLDAVCLIRDITTLLQNICDINCWAI